MATVWQRCCFFAFAILYLLSYESVQAQFNNNVSIYTTINSTNLTNNNNNNNNNKNGTQTCPKWNKPYPMNLSIPVLWILTVMQAVTLIFGLFGNILSFIIFSQTARSNNSDLYLCVLSISDSCSILFSGCLMYLTTYFRVLAYVYRWKIDSFFYGSWNQSPVCVFRMYFGFVWKHFSIWLIVLFTIERACVVRYPFSARFFTRKWAIRAVCSLFIGSVLLNLIYLWSFEPHEVKGMPGHFVCAINRKFLFFNFSNVLFTMFFPAILICGGNLVIIRVIRHRNQQPSMATTQQHVERQRRIAEHKITRRLLLVSSVFTALSTPIFLVHTIRNFKGIFNCYTEILETPWTDFMAINLILYNTNFSINFLIYAWVDSGFRRKVRLLLTCQCKLFKLGKSGESSGNPGVTCTTPLMDRRRLTNAQETKPIVHRRSI